MRRHRLPLLVCVSLLAVGVTSALVLPATATTGHRPYGLVQALQTLDGTIRISGWATDADTSGPATVNASIDGVRAATVVANRPNAHFTKPSGFQFAIPASRGVHRLCVSVDDYPSYSLRVYLMCTPVDLRNDPVGAITSLTQAAGKVTVHGWGIDSSQPLEHRSVLLFADGRPAVGGTAGAPVPGLHDTHPLAGDDHGFTLSFPMREGTHSVCLRVSNVGMGTERVVQCITPLQVSFSPSGAIWTVSQIPGGFHIRGYAQDPDSAAPVTVSISSNGRTYATALANKTVGATHGHAFLTDVSYHWRWLMPFTRHICVTAHNLGGYGEDRSLGCVNRYFSWNPSAGVESVKQLSPGTGALVSGWATDPDTSAPISVRLSEGATTLATVRASGTSGSHPGHMFSAVLPLGQGTHTICATPLNTGFGTGKQTPVCKSVSLDFNAYGVYESLTRAHGSTDVVATGWAIDPDTANPIQILVRIDGNLMARTANVVRPDVASAHPGFGAAHGFAVRLPADEGEHTVCINAWNVGAGSLIHPFLGCKIINAVAPKPPSAPTAVRATSGYGAATVTWSAPASDGGAPVSGYTVRSLPTGPTVSVGSTIRSTSIAGLGSSTRYTFSVVASNVAGSSPAGVSNAIVTPGGPAPQTTPAPISTSRYVRNVYGSSSTDLARMRSEGATDASHNPSGHSYATLLDIGGQDEYRHGLILTAGIRFVSYASMVRDLEAYVDGYASQQRTSAPAVIAIATNNDIDVSSSSGASFASNVIDPVAAYAGRYHGITIAGSDDMEPGFRASYSATKSWLQGFLGASRAPFMFTGSADGCAWTRTFGSCNNGWTASGLYYLAAGAAPTRSVNLPQIYNSTMAQQWRYISLTGVQSRQPKINFGGALTEYTACAQARSCGSLTGNSAWTYLWNDLRAEPTLRPSSLPYSTDLRIDS